MKTPSCHPSRKHYARNLCAHCYKRWLYKTNAKYRKKSRATGKAWWDKNKVKVLAGQRARYKASGGAEKDRAYSYRLRDKFGITMKEYERLGARQKWRCAICSQRQGGGRRLAVDHCHLRNQIRGLLCDRCNLIIGRMEDKPMLLHSAALYLERFLKACGVKP